MKVMERVVLSREAGAHLCHGEVGNDTERNVNTGPPANRALESLKVSGRQGLGWGGRALCSEERAWQGATSFTRPGVCRQQSWDDEPGIRGVGRDWQCCRESVVGTSGSGVGLVRRSVILIRTSLCLESVRSVAVLWLCHFQREDSGKVPLLLDFLFSSKWK